MNKRIAAVETTVSQCQSLYAKLEGMINDLQDDIATLLETQQAASLGPKGTDVNEDPADIGNTPSKGYRHYSDALFGKPGSDKTKQLPEESQPATVSSRLKVLLRNKN